MWSASVSYTHLDVYKRQVNASIEAENIRYHRHVNVGIAVALDWGLIVPVLKNADELNFLGDVYKRQPLGRSLF